MKANELKRRRVDYQRDVKRIQVMLREKEHEVKLNEMKAREIKKTMPH